MGRISKVGDADVRAALYVAAHAMLTRTTTWSSAKAWGMSLIKKKGRRRAVVAVARKLAVTHTQRYSQTHNTKHGDLTSMPD